MNPEILLTGLIRNTPSFPSPTCSYNTKWETADVCLSLAEYVIIKATGGANAPF